MKHPMQCEKCFRVCRLSDSGKTWVCTICKHREKANGVQAVSDTPRTDEEAFFQHDSKYRVCDDDFARTLERELNRACEMYRKLDIHALNLVDRIRRLEEAGDRMEKLMPDGSICDKAANAWREAKKAKP